MKNDWFNILKKKYVRGGSYKPSFYQQSQDAQAEDEYNEKMAEANRKFQDRSDLRGIRSRLGLGQRLLGEGRATDKRMAELRDEERDLRSQAHTMRRNIDEGRARGHPHKKEVMERPTILEGVEDMDSLSTMGQNFSNFPPVDEDSPMTFRPSWMGAE